MKAKKAWEDFDRLDTTDLEVREEKAESSQASYTPKLRIVEPNDGLKKKKQNRYFYKVANHHELFKIGRSFYTDYINGVRSFAIASTGYQTSQQKTILGLASFFDHKDDVRICIISDNLFECAFKSLIRTSEKVEMENEESGEKIDVYNFYDHFEFIDLNQLLQIAKAGEVEDMDEFIEEFTEQYDIVFWDVPELYKIQKDSEMYFPFVMKYESISIIVAQKLSKKKDVDDLKNFFLSYGINLKGLLFDEKTHQEEERKKEKESKVSKKPWWRIF